MDFDILKEFGCLHLQGLQSAGAWKLGAAGSTKMSLIYHRLIFMKIGRNLSSTPL